MVAVVLVVPAVEVMVLGGNSGRGPGVLGWCW